MKKLMAMVLIAGLMTVSLAACGNTVSTYVSEATETTASISNDDGREDESNSSFSSADEDRTSALASVVETEDGKVKTPYGDETRARVSFSDVDGDGTEDYAIAYEVEDGDLLYGEIDLYLNNELIYTIEDELIIEPGMMKYADYDGDGEREILFVYYPHVNSMPLDEYAVLKLKNGLWTKMEVPEDGNGSNSFPVHVKYGEEPCTLKISCDGCDKVIDYDAKAHYEGMLADSNYEYFADEYKRVLDGEGFVKGADYGMILPWGIWEVEDVMLNEEPCIRVLHGIAGAQLERYDTLGNLYIYFRFDEKGQVKIVDMEFFDDLSAETSE